MLRTHCPALILTALLLAPARASDDAAKTENKPEQSNPGTVADLAWLSGHWIHQDGDRVSEEVWIAPRGGVMLGVNRSVRGTDRVGFEFLRIAETKDGVTYFASLGGKPPTPFLLTHVDESAATFENADNDFPQRIRYERENDALTATIDGTIGREKRMLTWTWRRATDDSE